MKQTTVLLLTLLIALCNNQSIFDQFSIYTFLSYLHQADYYDLIYWAKCAYDDDIAIGTCIEFVNSVFCEPTVRIYMPLCRGICNPPMSLREYIYKNHMDTLHRNYTDTQINKKIMKLEKLIYEKCPNLKEDNTVKDVNEK